MGFFTPVLRKILTQFLIAENYKKKKQKKNYYLLKVKKHMPLFSMFNFVRCFSIYLCVTFCVKYSFNVFFFFYESIIGGFRLVFSYRRDRITHLSF